MNYEDMFFTMKNWPCRQPLRNLLNGYKHIVNVVYCQAMESKLPSFEHEIAQAKTTQVAPSTKKAVSYHDILEG